MEELEKLINARGREIKELQEGSLGSPSDKITAMKNSRQAVVKNNIESILTGIPREYLDSSIWWRTMVMEYEQCCFSMEQLMTRQAMTQLIKINKLKTQKETL